jgi:formate hydrogenlyase transcriptional activator
MATTAVSILLPYVSTFRSDLIGFNSGLRRVSELLNLVARTDSTVLIQGETGTGKELLARAIHEESFRKSRPYVKLNSAAIPTGLLESDLFGHERGAFTGAVTQTTGRFQLAHTGTLFLDEVGDVPLELQPKLLRVLQEREFEKVGGSRTIRVDVRLVAATNQDLHQLVRERRFRADLFYRLNVFPITLPPLRERRDDIPLLVHHFMCKYAARMSKDISCVSDRAMEVLRQYDWPGNVRELQNVVERSVIMSSGPSLEVPIEDFQRTVVGDSVARPLDEAQRQCILEVLRQSRGVIAGRNGAAVRLGLARTTLIYRMRKLGIAPERTSQIGSTW